MWTILIVRFLTHMDVWFDRKNLWAGQCRAMNITNRNSGTEHLAQETLDIGAVVADPDCSKPVNASMIWKSMKGRAA